MPLFFSSREKPIESQNAQDVSFYNRCMLANFCKRSLLFFSWDSNEILQKEIAISPVMSLAIHLTNANSSYGLSPFVDYKKLWDKNKVD